MPSANAIRAGAAYIELYTHDSRLVRGLASASKRLKAFGASVGTMGFKIAAAGTAMMAPLLGAAKLFASTGDQLDKMRARTGFTAQALSELGFAAEQGGASIDQLDRSLAAMASAFSLPSPSPRWVRAAAMLMPPKSIEPLKRPVMRSAVPPWNGT